MKPDRIEIKNGRLTAASLDFINTLAIFRHQKLKLAEDFLYLYRQPYLIKIDRIYLFGSCSKKQATVHSDIDLGIILEEDLTQWEKADLRQTWNDSGKYGVETNAVFISPDFDKNLRIFKEIEKGVLLYGN